MYYLSRGAAPEGPFEEARLVYMIQNGELSDGGVCPVGQNQWLPLHSVPAFAQALAARAAAAPAAHPQSPHAQAPAPPAPTQPDDPPAGYAPQQVPPPGYAAPQAPPAYSGAPPGYAAPQAPPGYSGAPPGYAPPQGQGAPPGYAPPGYAPPGYAAAAPHPVAPTLTEDKKSNRTLIIAAAAGVFLLLLVGAAIAIYLLFFASGGARSMSKSMPQNSEFMIEVPSVHKLVSDMQAVQYLDTSLRDDKQLFDTASDSIAKAFDISQTDAVTLLASSETFGIAGRKIATTPEAVLALGMKSASSVETLLKAPRFVAAGSIGSTGKRYTLTRKDVPAGADAVLKNLSEAEISATPREALVWFPNAKVLAIGTEAIVTDVAAVIESGAPSVEQSLPFQAASKDFDSKARLRAFLDPGVLSSLPDAKAKQFIDGYFTPSGPITGSLQVKPAGFVSSFISHVIGTKLPPSSSYEAPQALNLGQRLPEETLGYIALSTRTKSSGADAEKLLLDQIGSIEPSSRAQAEQGLHQLESQLGVSVSKLLDGVGGQSVFGIAAGTDTTIDTFGIGLQALAHFNLTWVLELKDASEYQKLAKQLKSKLLPGVREVSVIGEGTGFSLTPRALPLAISVRVKFIDKYLFVTAGANALNDRAEAAFSKGERTLKDDAAHKSALAALPDTQHFLMWLDTGRLGDTLLKNALVKAQLAQSSISLDKIKLSGPDRVTTALSLRSEVADEVWTYRLDALNFQALAPLGLGGAALGGHIAHLPGL